MNCLWTRYHPSFFRVWKICVCVCFLPFGVCNKICSNFWVFLRDDSTEELGHLKALGNCQQRKRYKGIKATNLGCCCMRMVKQHTSIFGVPKFSMPKKTSSCCDFRFLQFRLKKRFPLFFLRQEHLQHLRKSTPTFAYGEVLFLGEVFHAGPCWKRKQILLIPPGK